AIDDVVEAALEQHQQVLAGDALHARRLVVVAAELALGDAVDALDLLLLTQLLAVVRQLLAPRLTVLAGRIRAPLQAALVGVAAIALQEELHVFSTAQTTNGTDVTSHGSNPAPLGRAAAVVRNRSDVANQRDLEPGGLQRAQRRLAARSRPLHVHRD